jgi:hypothetical protein
MTIEKKKTPTELLAKLDTKPTLENVADDAIRQSATAALADTPAARGRPLQGAKALCDYCGISINTLMKWIFHEDLPATHIGGSWQSDTALIDRWRLGRIVEDTRNRSELSKDDAAKRHSRW